MRLHSVQKLGVFLSEFGAEVVESFGQHQPHLLYAIQVRGQVVIEIQSHAIQQLIMTDQHSEQESQEQVKYQWLNRKQYQDSNLQGEVDCLLTKQKDQIEQGNISKLFFRLMKHSRVGLVHFNDETKEFNLYNIPQVRSIVDFKFDHISYLSSYDDIRNRFYYIFVAGHKFGERGSNIYLAALNNRSKFKYSLSYEKIFRERLDSCYCANIDEVAFHWIKTTSKIPGAMELVIAKESRQNYLNFYDKKSEENHKFGMKAPQSNLPKHSNLLTFKYIYKYDPFTAIGKFGVDFANQSVFKSLYVGAYKNINLWDSFIFKCYAVGAQIWGKNIMKNDMFFRNTRHWPGDRCRNYLSSRFQLHFTKYPYLSVFKIQPYLYSQLWASFNLNEQKSYDTRLEGEYGIGLSTNDEKFKLDFSLFTCSAVRKQGMLGSLKFSF